MSLLGELQRRNVFRVALLYIFSAWVVIQVAETVLPIFDVPPGVLRAIVIILAIGLIPALVFSWVFELTPEGIRKETRTSATPEIREQMAARLNWATLGVATLAIILLVADRLMPEADWSSATQPVANEQSPTSTDIALNGTSIAVLAFENMSPDPDNAYFAEGISEEILNVLASVEGLKVASRTSAFSFSGAQVPIPEIAKRLGVIHVLEGSVRRVDDRVRITAQLIDARDDQHLWSDAFDRDLVDIFAVQEEIALAITQALTEQLGIRQVSVSAPTENFEAYEAFLRGRQQFYRRSGALEEVGEAIENLERAVDLDPQFADAWALLAAAHFVVLPIQTEHQLIEKTLASSSEAMSKALTINPDQRLALAIRGYMTIIYDLDWLSGLEDLERAASEPGQDSTPDLWLAIVLSQAGFAEQALTHARRAWEIDPMIAINNAVLANIYLALDQPEQAEQPAQFAFENGRWEGVLELADYHLAQGHLDEADRLYRKAINSAAPETEPQQLALMTSVLEAVLKDRSSGQLSEPTLNLISLLPSFWQFKIFAAFDKTEEAVNALLRHMAEVEDEYLVWTRMLQLPHMVPVREHPLIFEKFQEVGLVALWEKRAYPPRCRRVHGQQGSQLECR